MFVSVVVVRALIEELAKKGLQFDAAALSAVSPQLDDMRQRIRASELEPLVSRAMVMTRDPALGLTLGFGAPERFLQLVGYVAMSGLTPVDAFHAYRRYAWLLVDGLEFELELRDNVAKFRFSFEGAVGGDLDRFANDFVMANTLRILRTFGEKRRPHMLMLSHPEPAYADRYRSLFDCPVRFGQRENALIGEASALSVQQHHYDKSTVLLLQEAADKLADSARRQSLTGRVRESVRLTPDMAALSQQKLARAFGLSTRVLRRRLAAEGSSLSDILEQTKRELAIQELTRQGGSLKVAAALAGYAEPSSFCRAFKRWTGESPAYFRRHHGVSADDSTEDLGSLEHGTT